MNLPYIDNGPSSARDIAILGALLETVNKFGGNRYLHGRAKVAPYDDGTTSGRIVTFASKGAFVNGAPSDADAILLQALLEGLISANLAYMNFRYYPPLFRTQVYYARTQVWDSIPSLISRGFGDCKSLSAARIAEMRRDGIAAKPVFRWIKERENGKDFHILIQSVLGYEDPSRILGMGSDENVHF